MTEEKDEKKRTHLRLVVNNPEKRPQRPAEGEGDFVPFEELVARREAFRADFYRGMDRWQAQSCERLERFFAARGWSYGLDPYHGQLMVLPAAAIAPDVIDYGATLQDEVLLFVTEDASGMGLCLTLEMILPFYSDDDSVMEDALLYAPLLPYGTLFLEENRQDGFLDLIYRVAFPLYPPVPTRRLLEKLFAAIAYELRETLRALVEYPEA